MADRFDRGSSLGASDDDTLDDVLDRPIGAAAPDPPAGTAEVATHRGHTMPSPDETRIASLDDDEDTDEDGDDAVDAQLEEQRAEIEETRANISSTLDELKEKLAPAALAQDAKAALADATSHAADRKSVV